MISLSPYKLTLILSAMACLWVTVLQAQVFELDIQPVLPSGSKANSEKTNSSAYEIQRLDFLLSKLALQREDGTWLESADWFAFYSMEKGRLKARAEGIPAGKFTAIRFNVGLPQEADLSDPNQRPVDHALHPDVCGLHWGWQGGYVFMALEGRWGRPDASQGGFSYHLAKAPNAVHVVIPVDFQGGGPLTVKLRLDASRLFQGVDFAHHGTSTHSRDGDPLVSLLRKNIEQAFSLQAVHYDLYQTATSIKPTLSSASAPSEFYNLAITNRFPQPSLPSDNPLTRQGVALGEALFHDPRLSINNSQSCASCHQRSAAFADSRKLSLGAEGQLGKRQAMPLFNLAWEPAFFWDGRAKTLREQVLLPIQDKHEMNEKMERAVAKIADQKEAFFAVFGTTEITAEFIAKALEQYLLSLISQESRFDRAVRKVAHLTEEEKRGLQLFVTEFDPARGLRGADCFHCHGGTLFTDHQFKNNGLDLIPSDFGRMEVTGLVADRGKFKTPSLRNIAATAPYMHDGRFATLEEVVEHYSTRVQRSENLDPNLAKHPDAGLQLTKEEKQALVAFLKTLTDEDFIAPQAPSKVAQQP